jgi:hypothetical protein
MLFNTLQIIELFKILFFIDTDLAERFRLKACPHCGAPLHSANYPRSPRGGPENIPDQWLIRHSFCCSNEHCRRRALPPSCRFWDRKVYWGSVILVALTLRQGRHEGYSINKLTKKFGVSRHTLKRWITYFQEVFPISHRWKRIKGQISIFTSHDDLPGIVIHLFIRQSRNTMFGLINSIKFLSGGFEMA